LTAEKKTPSPDCAQDLSGRAPDKLEYETNPRGLEFDGLGHGPEIVDSLRKLIRSFDVQSRRLRDNHKLTLPQLVCLRSLLDFGPQTVKGIGSRVHLGASTLVGILDRLELKGLVERSRNPKDRREVIVVASEAGRSLVQNVHSPLRDGLSRSLSALPIEEQVMIASSLSRLFDLMQTELQNSATKEAKE